MDAYREIFNTESAEFIQGIIDGLLALEHNPADSRPLEVIFRGAHSLKGMSAAMGYERTADLTHKMESLADRVRRGERAVDSALIDLMLDAVDTLKALVEAEAAGGTCDVNATEVIARLAAATEATDVPDTPPSSAESCESTPAHDLRPTVRVDVTLADDCVLKAVRAYMVIKRLGYAGEVLDTLPSANDIEDERFDRVFSVFLDSVMSAEDIRTAVFGVSEIEQVDVSTADIAASAPRPSEAVPDATPSTSSPTRLSVPKLTGTQTVRISIGHLDTLVDLVGELVILRSRLEGIAGVLGAEELDEALEDLRRVSAELQHEVMHARMVPVANVFNRFPRMVRDLARELGKDIEFEMDGLDIELDRTVLDEIGDPLVHMLRNSVDHGIEEPDTRLAAGKSPRGRVRLTASRERDLVRIVVSDDGAGIDAERVWRKACEAGLVDAASRDAFHTEDLVMLTAVPGFSTVDEATRYSGRGVGLDAVKGKIEYLGGTLSIQSAVGTGTEVVLLLPLTLAIIQALLVEVAGQVFAVPLGSVTEVLSPIDAHLDTVDGACVLLHPDGQVVPVHRLDVLLGMSEGLVHEMPGPQEHLVVLTDGTGHLRALVVQGLLGRREIVVKPLGGLLADVKGMSGATVLGDGSVSLILDPRTVFSPREEA
jgi:two-component system chemotaxis sensor kinase CheA